MQKETNTYFIFVGQGAYGPYNAGEVIECVKTRRHNFTHSHEVYNKSTSATHRYQDIQEQLYKEAEENNIARNQYFIDITAPIHNRYIHEKDIEEINDIEDIVTPFLHRAIAYIVDAILISLIALLFQSVLWLDSSVITSSNNNLFWSVIIDMALVLAFWTNYQATPGQMLFGCVVVDQTTLRAPTFTQYLARYLLGFLSTIPLGLGFLCAMFDNKTQTLHDLLARTYVVYKKELEILLSKQISNPQPTLAE